MIQNLDVPQAVPVVGGGAKGSALRASSSTPLSVRLALSYLSLSGNITPECAETDNLRSVWVHTAKFLVAGSHEQRVVGEVCHISNTVPRPLALTCLLPQSIRKLSIHGKKAELTKKPFSM